MRTPLEIPTYLVREASLYAPSRDALDAVCHVLTDYPRVIAELRQLRRRVSQLDGEELDFDQRLEALQDACRAILAL
jgi:hypothetical protein